ncbi:hypothetical protein KY290_027921 [Solanum tuberosum]|uniref:Uncharacterized protein n=1 Tax=Solanum tuberosum TaxID=4113 RepID=A0ABQ7UI52_SOLTU|nr:hypothetical protein KY290_027921 [Solanum tuberosum]
MSGQGLWNSICEQIARLVICPLRLVGKYLEGNLEVGGMGGVFSDSSENWVLGFMKGVPKATNNMTELCALLYRLRITVIDGDATSTSADSLLQRTEPRHRLTS